MVWSCRQGQAGGQKVSIFSTLPGWAHGPGVVKTGRRQEPWHQAGLGLARRAVTWRAMTGATIQEPAIVAIRLGAHHQQRGGQAQPLPSDASRPGRSGSWPRPCLVMPSARSR